MKHCVRPEGVKIGAADHEKTRAKLIMTIDPSRELWIVSLKVGAVGPAQAAARPANATSTIYDQPDTALFQNLVEQITQTQRS
ncbi:hypothetical protein EVAR_78769_1 [Eumeta japonica]|uniref:Uncharacterized protein n=1 Tax=Eumeta variegata TaxID=151549 RepID=A0A4C1T246_EUMVA|nr:hypothetical protein EVAR_78769_1 [Eumeta japonica]